jgi:hypothetical protein
VISFPQAFLAKLCMHFFSPMHASWLFHLILLDLFTLIIFGEEPKLWSSSLCSFLHFVLPLRSRHYTQHSVFKCPQSMFLPSCERPSFTPIQNQRQNKVFVYFNSRFVDSQWEEWRFRTE